MNNTSNEVISVVQTSHQRSRATRTGRIVPFEVDISSERTEIPTYRTSSRPISRVSNIPGEEGPRAQQQNARSSSLVIPPGAVFYKGPDLPKEHTFEMTCSGSSAASRDPENHEYYRHDITGAGSNQYMKKYKCRKCNHKYQQRV